MCHVFVFYIFFVKPFLKMPNKPSKRLTILVTAFNAVGHMNAVAGATKALMERGHRMIFLVEKSFADKFHPLGYEEHVYSSKPDSNEASGK